MKVIIIRTFILYANSDLSIRWLHHDPAGAVLMKLFSYSFFWFSCILWTILNLEFLQWNLSRIVPLKWFEAIGLRFELVGCKQLTPSPLVSLPPSSATTTTGPGPATCMYWTPWVNTNTPDATGDYETITHLNSLVQSCSSSSIRAIECRTVGSRKSWNEAGDMDVKCDLDSQGLLCFNKVQRSGQCQDYEIRVFCDECPSKNSKSGSLSLDYLHTEGCDNKYDSVN